MLNKVQRLKAELITKGQLYGFEEIIEKLIRTISDANCDISCCDICTNSSIEQSTDDSNKPHIRIGFKTSRKKPIHVIWDILHEFGHFLSGKANGKESKLFREIAAWDLGMKHLQCYPKLIIYLDDYKDYRDNCLRSYQNKV